MPDHIPHTPAERSAMLHAVGVGSIGELFDDIPAALRAPALDLPPALTELELQAHLAELGARNRDVHTRPCFLGAGYYRHHLPAAVAALVQQGGFLTSYTPYEPEVSQGMLQAIYEYQTLIAQLTEMDVSNASLYDGASALAEAALLATHATGRRRLAICPNLNPDWRLVLQTYALAQSWELVDLPERPAESGQMGGTADVEAGIPEGCAAVIVQHPNFLGLLERCPDLGERAHAAGALLIAAVNPISLGVLVRPGAYGADIAVGEGQPLGNPMSFGGPGLGFMAVREPLLRRLPGRLVGMTHDSDGRRAFTLTLQTREQHIRREKATSNICTNQALNALAAAIYLSLMGPQGIYETASLCLERAHALRARLRGLPGVSFPVSEGAPYFHEFALNLPLEPQEMERRCHQAGIIGPLALGARAQRPGFERSYLFCATEVTTAQGMDMLVEALS